MKLMKYSILLAVTALFALGAYAQTPAQAQAAPTAKPAATAPAAKAPATAAPAAPAATTTAASADSCEAKAVSKAGLAQASHVQPAYPVWHQRGFPMLNERGNA